jgi:hypothetical protein
MPLAARRSTRKTSTGIRLPRVDGRTRSVRRYRELIATFEAEIGREPAEADRILLKQAAAIALRAEQLEDAIVAGDAVDPDLVIRLSSEVRRILDRLKDKSDQAKVPPPTSLDELLARHGAET